MTQWVKVEFYGAVPDGEVVADVNMPVVAAKLAATFGFVLIDCLTVTAAGPPYIRNNSAPDCAPSRAL